MSKFLIPFVEQLLTMGILRFLSIIRGDFIDLNPNWSLGDGQTDDIVGGQTYSD